MARKKPHNLTHMVITCACGNTREIRVQDQFQTIKCVECQRQSRLEQRRRLHEAERDKRGGTKE